MTATAPGPRPWMGRAFGIGLVLLLVGAAYAFWQAGEDFGEVHAVRDEVRKLEAAVNSHDSKVLAIIEEVHGKGPVLEPMAEDDREHRRMIDILDRLSHAQGFRLEPCHVHVEADKALVSCDVQGTPEPPSQVMRNPVPVPLPRALHIEYRRAPQGWGLWSIEPVDAAKPVPSH